MGVARHTPASSFQDTLSGEQETAIAFVEEPPRRKTGETRLLAAMVERAVLDLQLPIWSDQYADAWGWISCDGDECTCCGIRFADAVEVWGISAAAARADLLKQRRPPARPGDPTPLDDAETVALVAACRAVFGEQQASHLSPRLLVRGLAARGLVLTHDALVMRLGLAGIHRSDMPPRPGSGYMGLGYLAKDFLPSEDVTAFDFASRAGQK